MTHLSMGWGPSNLVLWGGPTRSLKTSSWSIYLINDYLCGRPMKYKCGVCGYVYDESKEGVKFSDLPDDWVCPVCGEGKWAFEPLEAN